MLFRSHSFIAVVAAVLVGLTTAGMIDDVALEANAGESERIVRGENAEAGQFPYAVALHYNGNFICTASIISPTTVMTAAHCVVFDGETAPADFFYGIANVNRSSPSVRIDFASVISHENYGGGSIDNDIALLKTIDPISFSDEVQPVCIASPNTAMNQYKNATAMGWGNISPIRLIVIIPEMLQFVEQKIVPNRRCSYLNPGVNEDKICAQGFFTGVCNGDSGGPLVHLSAEQPPVEIGIASYINGLVGCGKTVPAVWTRVSSFYDWIMQNAGDPSICTV